MFFPTNVVALITALIYIFIAFKIPGKYKSCIRFYSIFIQVSFMLFVIIYPLFSRTQTDNTNLYIYSLWICSLGQFVWQVTGFCTQTPKTCF